jgi:hypothetical protein
MEKAVKEIITMGVRIEKWMKHFRNNKRKN